MVQLIIAVSGLSLVVLLVVGLSRSISTGSAGIKDGLPFAIIAVIVAGMVAYDVWDECLRKKR